MLMQYIAYFLLPSMIAPVPAPTPAAKPPMIAPVPFFLLMAQLLHLLSSITAPLAVLLHFLLAGAGLINHYYFFCG
jgi:hypothetical protein